MSDTGKQSPLGVNTASTLLINQGLQINPNFTNYVGKSKDNANYTPGKIVNETCLKWLTAAITDAYNRGESSNPAPLNSIVSIETYNNMLAIGQSRIPALGNSKPPTYIVNDPSGVWTDIAASRYPGALPGPATSGYGISGLTGSAQSATWYPYTGDPLENPNTEITKFGWIRCLALQAWNEFNFNGKEPNPADPFYEPAYKDYVSSFMTCDSFIKLSNEAIYSLRNGIEFLDGTYSNMNDLISADITGVSLSTQAFGQDLINLGKVFDLTQIPRFGLPSSLLKIIQKNSAMTPNLNLALLGSGLTVEEIETLSEINDTPINVEQEQKIYGSFLLISGESLIEIVVPLNCRTKGLQTLADLLNVKKMFPLSYPTLTVPVYNVSPGPTNSKTYYLLFVDNDLNPQLLNPKIKEIVGPPVVPQPPPIIEPPVVPPIIETIETIVEENPTIPVQEIIQVYIPVQPSPVEEIIQIIPPPEQNPPIPPLPKPGGGGGCVALESFVPLVEKEQKHNGREITKAWMLESGIKISLGTDSLEIVDGRVIKTLNDYQPCVRISTADGITLVCSTTAPILTKDSGFIPATEVYGKRVAVMRNGRTWYDEVVGLEDVGMKFVRVIDAGNNSFWAGERPGSFILHHNVPIKDALNFDKK